MKKLICILVFLLLASCKEETNKSMDMEVYAAEKAEIDANWNITVSNKYSIDETFEFKELTAQKLQELYDLSTLKNNHPEFKETIVKQLKTLTNDSLLFSKISDSVAIKNIEFITDSFKTTDSIQKVKLRYNLITNNSVKRDSINAEIISKKIILDGKELLSNKIKFTKI